jgi:hypothetical protein
MDRKWEREVKRLKKKKKGKTEIKERLRKRKGRGTRRRG